MWGPKNDMFKGTYFVKWTCTILTPKEIKGAKKTAMKKLKRKFDYFRFQVNFLADL